VARFFDVSPQTIFEWVEHLAQSGEKVRLPKRKKMGRPPKVNAAQLRWVAATIREYTPDQLNLEGGLWTMKLVAQLMRNELNLVLSRPTMFNVMKQLGLVPARPIHLAHQGDEGWGGHWAAALPALHQHAKGRRKRILFADETDLPGRCHAAQTGPVRMLSALSVSGELQFMLVQGAVDAQVFKTFLRQLVMGMWRPTLLAVESRPMYQHPLIEEFVQSTRGRLSLHHLPLYEEALLLPA
jgi:transposase